MKRSRRVEKIENTENLALVLMMPRMKNY